MLSGSVLYCGCGCECECECDCSGTSVLLSAVLYCAAMWVASLSVDEVQCPVLLFVLSCSVLFYG